MKSTKVGSAEKHPRKAEDVDREIVRVLRYRRSNECPLTVAMRAAGVRSENATRVSLARLRRQGGPRWQRIERVVEGAATAPKTRGTHSEGEATAWGFALVRGRLAQLYPSQEAAVADAEVGAVEEGGVAVAKIEWIRPLGVRREVVLQ